MSRKYKNKGLQELYDKLILLHSPDEVVKSDLPQELVDAFIYGYKLREKPNSYKVHTLIHVAFYAGQDSALKTEKCENCRRNTPLDNSKYCWKCAGKFESKPCQRCGEPKAFKGFKFCKACNKVVKSEMWQSGFLMKTGRFSDQPTVTDRKWRKELNPNREAGSPALPFEEEE